VLSRAVPVPGPIVPGAPVPSGAPAFPPTEPALPRLPVPELPDDCAMAPSGHSAAAPASTPVPTHLVVRFMTVAFPRESFDSRAS